MDAKIHVSRLGGTATVPPSKSAAHRAVLCAALAEGTSHITNIEYSKDIRATLGAAAQLGAKITEEAHSVTIKGHGTAGGFVTVTRPVFCNESGSTLRFMIPLFSLTAQKVRFTGAGRLFDRPQAIYQMLFERQGLQFEQTPEGITIFGRLRPAGSPCRRRVQPVHQRSAVCRAADGVREQHRGTGPLREPLLRGYDG